MQAISDSTIVVEDLVPFQSYRGAHSKYRRDHSSCDTPKYYTQFKVLGVFLQGRVSCQCVLNVLYIQGLTDI